MPANTPAATSVFTTVLTRGPVSRVDIARITGLSPAAVTKAARPLIAAGYLTEQPSTDRAQARAGRPANPLAIRPDREFFVGVKITADELIGVVTDLQARIVVARHRPLPSAHTDAVMAELAALVGELAEAAPAHRLGLAVSGDVDRLAGMVRYSPFLGWHDVSLAKLAEDATGLVTTVENDVKALAVAEHWFGEGATAASFALVTVGAGIGCALVLDGRLIVGAHGVAGELGHVPVSAGAERCHCGATGCLEAVAATAPLLARARQIDPTLTLDVAAERARAGDAALRAVFDRAGHAIGLGLAAVANLVGPERIVVSGEGLAAYDLLESGIRASFRDQAFGAAARCELVVRPLPFEEWARGAAAVAIDTLITPP
jgi:predicted NBD/HSP70 family sugar kinase